MPYGIAYPLTSRTYVSLSIARGIAAGRGHRDVTAAHVALGILREAENCAVAALQHGGVALWKLRHELEIALPAKGHPLFGELLLPETLGEYEIVGLAAAEVAERGDVYLGNEHLLLGILRDPATPVAQIFSRHGCTHETAVTHLTFVQTRKG